MCDRVADVVEMELARVSSDGCDGLDGGCLMLAGLEAAAAAAALNDAGCQGAHPKPDFGVC
jgi:hypothetical protein